MIPTQISIEGFLCYRQKQVIDLQGMDLCMLSGPNGSGKSSVFDALTIALFNTHRAGKINREELINKKCDTATVELEFELNAVRFQARRSLTRGGGSTYTIRRWSELKNDWTIVPDTSSANGYGKWVEEHIGLSAETFTSSMLLRQGHADRLLTAQPKERSQLLGTVVGLNEYEQLHAKASDGRRTRQGKRSDLEAQLNGMRQVTDAELTAAAASVETAKLAATEANARIERLQPLLEQSKNWADLQRDVQASEAELRKLEGLLVRAATLEQDAARLRELAGVLPRLRGLLKARAQRESSAAKVKQLTAQLDEATARSAAVTEQTTAIRDTQTTAAAEAERLLERDRVATTRLAELGVILSRIEAAEKQRAELTGYRAQIQKLGAPDQEMEQAKAEVQRLGELNDASPWLTQISNHRQTIREAQQAHDENRKVASEAGQELTTVASELQGITAAHNAAETAHRAAQAREAEATAALNQARAALKALAKANGQAACPTCGHDLTPAHLADEQARREATEKNASQARAVAAQAQQTAAAGLERLRARRNQLETQRGQLEKRLDSASREVRGTGDEIQKALKQCVAAHRALTPLYRDRVGEFAAGAEQSPAAWLATTWPAPKDLTGIKTELAALVAAKDRLGNAQAAFNQWNTLHAKIAVLDRALAESGAPQSGDGQPLREEHARLNTEQAALRQAINAGRGRAAKLKQDLDALAATTNALAKTLATLGKEIAAENARIEGYEKAIEKDCGELSGQWTTTTVDQPLIERLERELKQLNDAGAEQAEKQLKEAQATSLAIGAKLELLRKQVDAVPSEARQPPAAINGQLEAARAQRNKLQEAHGSAATELIALQKAKEDRTACDARYKQLDREHGHYQLLSDLLGRDGLQRHLMREAEKAIVKFANAILDPISNGDLMLRLRGDAEDGDSDNVLDLEACHTRISPNDAIPVPFLSGSQQFRVAVALALAIGQYAGGGGRLGECVIIDEGFGSLDSQGQDVMIEELQRLKGIMKRIILVSHQESFANAFTSGFRFQLEDGETRVARVSA